MTASKIQFRPGTHIAEALGGYVRNGVTEHAAAKSIVEAYLEIMRRSLPVLSVPEWNCVNHALRGSIYEPSQIDWWRADVRDTVVYSGAAKKWKLPDADRFLERIDSLSLAECAAVADYARRYWAAVSREEDPKVPGEE